MRDKCKKMCFLVLYCIILLAIFTGFSINLSVLAEEDTETLALTTEKPVITVLTHGENSYEECFTGGVTITHFWNSFAEAEKLNGIG